MEVHEEHEEAIVQPRRCKCQFEAQTFTTVFSDNAL